MKWVISCLRFFDLLYNILAVKTKKRDHNSIKKHLKHIKSDQISERLIRTTLISLFILFSIMVILYARGYRFDPVRKELSSTGILAISSTPRAAKVYINGDFRGATDLNLSLNPGTYTVEVKKEGFTSYSKTLKLRGEIVETVDPILFPLNPSLSPLTNLGVTKAIEIDSSDKILVFSENGNLETDGIYVFEASRTPLNIFQPLKRLVLKSSLLQSGSFTDSDVIFSHDYKQAIIIIDQDDSQVAYLVSLDQENQIPLNVTESEKALVAAWDKEQRRELLKIFEAYPKEIRKIASDSFSMTRYSPDQTKVLYRAEKTVNLPLVIEPPLIGSNQTSESRALQQNHIYVYDRKEDKNFEIGNADSDINSIRWYSDSRHLVFGEEKQIVLSSYDGTAKQTLYSGPLSQRFFALTSSGQLLILSNLNPLQNPLPDIYEVGIR